MKYWMHGITDADTHARRLAAAGFVSVVVRSVSDARIVRETGMDAWLCGSGFPLIRDDDSIKAVGIDGLPHVWFNSASPCAREVREASLEKYRRMAESDGVAGILIDGCRFASPASGPAAFLTDFSPHAETRAEELGFDFAAMRSDLGNAWSALRNALSAPGRLADERQTPDPSIPIARVVEALGEYPGVLEWLRFRRTCTSDHFRAIAEIVHGAGMRCGAYVFSPSIAPLVGQNYADLARIMDVVSPMVYRIYPTAPGIAALNHEVAAIIDALFPPDTESSAAVSAILDALGFRGLASDPTASAARGGLDVRVVGLECARARAALGDDATLVPIIQLDDPDLHAAIREVDAAGVDAVNFFRFAEDWGSRIGRPGAR